MVTTLVLKSGIMLLVLGCLIHVVSFSVPHWYSDKIPGHSVYGGLWLLCVEDVGCDATPDGVGGALNVKVIPTRAECFSNCFHHRLCNRFLHNDLTGECRLLSSEGNSVSTAVGFKYYAANCLVSKQLPPQQCPLQFAPFEGSSGYTGLCYDGDNWVDDGNGDLTCSQIEWIDTYDTSFILPAAITPGFVVDIRVTWESSTDLFCALRQPDGAEETTVLRLAPGSDPYTGQISHGQWMSTIYINPMPLAPGETFDLRAAFNSTHYQVSLNGSPVATDVIQTNISASTYLLMVNWGLIDHIEFIYP